MVGANELRQKNYTRTKAINLIEGSFYQIAFREAAHDDQFLFDGHWPASFSFEPAPLLSPCVASCSYWQRSSSPLMSAVIPMAISCYKMLLPLIIWFHQTAQHVVKHVSIRVVTVTTEYLWLPSDNLTSPRLLSVVLLPALLLTNWPIQFNSITMMVLTAAAVVCRLGAAVA